MLRPRRASDINQSNAEWHAPEGIHDVREENPRDSTPDRRYGEVFICELREPIGGDATGVRAAAIDPIRGKRPASSGKGQPVLSRARTAPISATHRAFPLVLFSSQHKAIRKSSSAKSPGFRRLPDSA